MNEFEIIAEIFAPLARDPGAFGLKDDAAVIAPRPGIDLIVTTDQIAEGSDFFAHDSAGSVAKKALRVNLSDLTAKGAKPAFYLLTIALPAGMTMEWLTAFAAGLQADQEKFGISLLGGDTGRSEGPLSITITAFGFVPEGQMIRRSGARPGDDVYVTGTIGDSGGGLAIFKREKHSLGEQDRDYLTTRYRLPEPPVTLGEKLRGLASASVDVSDGLIADLSVTWLGPPACASWWRAKRCRCRRRCARCGATERCCAPFPPVTITRSFLPQRRAWMGHLPISGGWKPGQALS